MITLRREKRLPRSRLIWSMVTEVSSGSVRGILLLKTYVHACLVTPWDGIAGWMKPGVPG
jgi:hypothetical protein